MCISSRPLDASPSGCASRSRRCRESGPSCRWSQGYAVVISVRRHQYEHMHRYARRLNPPACGFLMSPDANCLRRHCRARRRYRSAFGDRPPPTGAPLPHVVDERPGTKHALSPPAGGTAHRAAHHRHEREIWEPSPSIPSGRVQMDITHAHNRRLSTCQCLSVCFLQPTIGDDSFNRLTLCAISGELTAPSKTGASDMRPTPRKRYTSIVAPLITALLLVGTITVSPSAEAREHIIEIVTRIDPGDPVAGMKSTHRIGVDVYKRKLRRLQVKTGNTYGIPSTRNKFTERAIRWDGCSRGDTPMKCVKLQITGRTGSGVQVIPNIDYDFTIFLSHDGLSAIHGCHDGYPTYLVTVNGQTLYHFRHKPIRLFKLFGNCDIKPRTSIGGWVGY